MNDRQTEATFHARRWGKHVQLWHGDELVMKVSPEDAGLIAEQLSKVSKID